MDASTSAPTPASAAGTPTPDRPPLDVEELRRALLVGGGLWTAVEVSSTTASTNADVVAAVAQGAPEGLVVTTEHQTAGRGRLGRSWHSAAGDSLTFSLALPYAPADWSGLSLAVGVALADALDPEGHAIGLKWPNDLWLRDGSLQGTPGAALTVYPARVSDGMVEVELPEPERPRSIREALLAHARGEDATGA